MTKRGTITCFIGVIGCAGIAQADFEVFGLAGTGVTADISFAYAVIDDSNATITIDIHNTTPDSGDTAGAFISAFGFNIPSLGGVTIDSIGGDVDDGAVQIVTLLGAPNEGGWYGRFDPDEIKTPNAAGFFDYGVMNNSTVNAFITDGVGTSPNIIPGETTTFTLAVTGTGLSSLTDSSFLSALSVGGPAGAFNFAVRFKGIGLDDDSDLAVVPVPSSMILCALGLGSLGMLQRSKRQSLVRATA